MAELVLEASHSAASARGGAPDRRVGTLRRGARLRDVTDDAARGARPCDAVDAAARSARPCDAVHAGPRGDGRLAGWLRAVRQLPGAGWTRAVAEAGGRRWEFHAGLAEVRASDAAGSVVGEFRPRLGARGGGVLRWQQRELELRTPSFRARRFELEAGERALAVVAHGRPRQPLRMRIDDRAELDPGLLLFCAFVVRVLSAHHDADTGGA